MKIFCQEFSERNEGMFIVLFICTYKVRIMSVANIFDIKKSVILNPATVLVIGKNNFYMH